MSDPEEPREQVNEAAASEPPPREHRAVAEPPPLTDALGAVVRRLMWIGRQELTRTARTGRVRLELRQLQADRDRFWIRLGKSAYHLVEGGEIDHPALRKAMVRIDQLEGEIAELRARLSAEAEEHEE